MRVADLPTPALVVDAAALAHNLDTMTSAGLSVVPVMVSDPVRAVRLTDKLLERGGHNMLFVATVNYTEKSLDATLEMLKHRDMPLENLFRVQRESDTYNLPEGQAVFYAKSWAVVDWLLRNGGRNNAAFYDFFRDIESGVPWRELEEIVITLNSYSVTPVGE